jgi:hypothetical protein
VYRLDRREAMQVWGGAAAARGGGGGAAAAEGARTVGFARGGSASDSGGRWRSANYIWGKEKGNCAAEGARTVGFARVGSASDSGGRWRSASYIWGKEEVARRCQRWRRRSRSWIRQGRGEMEAVQCIASRASSPRPQPAPPSGRSRPGHMHRALWKRKARAPGKGWFGTHPCRFEPVLTFSETSG